MQKKKGHAEDDNHDTKNEITKDTMEREEEEKEKNVLAEIKTKANKMNNPTNSQLEDEEEVMERKTDDIGDINAGDAKSCNKSNDKVDADSDDDDGDDNSNFNRDGDDDGNGADVADDNGEVADDKFISLNENEAKSNLKTVMESDNDDKDDKDSGDSSHSNGSDSSEENDSSDDSDESLETDDSDDSDSSDDDDDSNDNYDSDNSDDSNDSKEMSKSTDRGSMLIAAAVRSVLKQRNKKNKPEMVKLKKWLRRIDMGQHAVLFRKHKCTSLKALMKMDFNSIIKMIRQFRCMSRDKEILIKEIKKMKGIGAKPIKKLDPEEAKKIRQELSTWKSKIPEMDPSKSKMFQNLMVVARAIQIGETASKAAMTASVKASKAALGAEVAGAAAIAAVAAEAAEEIAAAALARAAVTQAITTAVATVAAVTAEAAAAAAQESVEAATEALAEPSSIVVATPMSSLSSIVLAASSLAAAAATAKSSSSIAAILAAAVAVSTAATAATAANGAAALAAAAAPISSNAIAAARKAAQMAENAANAANTSVQTVEASVLIADPRILGNPRVMGNQSFVPIKFVSFPNFHWASQLYPKDVLGPLATEIDDFRGQTPLDVNLRWKSSEQIDQDTAIKTTKLIQSYLKKLPALEPMILILRRFFIEWGLNNTRAGYPSFYCVVLMIVTFLQYAYKAYGSKKHPNVGGLLIDFLNFYGNHFDYQKMCVRYSYEGNFHYLASKSSLYTRAISRFGPILIIDDPLREPSNIGTHVTQFPKVTEAFRCVLYRFRCLLNTPREENDPKSYLDAFFPKDMESLYTSDQVFFNDLSQSPVESEHLWKFPPGQQRQEHKSWGVNTQYVPFSVPLKHSSVSPSTSSKDQSGAVLNPICPLNPVRILPPGTIFPSQPATGFPASPNLFFPPNPNISPNASTLPPALDKALPPNLGSNFSPNMGTTFSPNMPGFLPSTMQGVFPPNVGTAFPPNMGSFFPSNVGTAFPPNMGSFFPPNMGTFFPPNMGTAFPPNMGTAFPPNMGTAFPPNMGAAFPPNMGAAFPPNPGTAFPRSVPTPGSDGSNQSLAQPPVAQWNTNLASQKSLLPL